MQKKYHYLSLHKKENKSAFCLRYICKSYKLKKQHVFYYQIQGQLHITRRSWCDLVVWSPSSTVDSLFVECVYYYYGTFGATQHIPNFINSIWDPCFPSYPVPTMFPAKKHSGVMMTCPRVQLLWPLHFIHVHIITLSRTRRSLRRSAKTRSHVHARLWLIIVCGLAVIVLQNWPFLNNYWSKGHEIY